MNDLVFKTAVELDAMLSSRQVTALEVTDAFLARIEALNPRINAYLYVDAEGARATAAEVDRKREAGQPLERFAGVPIAVKDNMCTKGLPTTCASKMLEGWIPPYDATVIETLKRIGMPILGKTNMDEFAMGSSTEHSAFGLTRNPWDEERIPGGSGGGSAAAVAAYLAPCALGSDTGGSIRQPGAVTGTVGVKPTYGAVSRYGLIAMASSLDQIGPVTRTVEDAAALQDIISGHDPLDSTSLPNQAELLPEVAAGKVDGGDQALAGLTIGVVKEMGGEGYEPGVEDLFKKQVERCREAGATIVEVSCPSFDYALAAYYLIMPAEVSSNLARFDGMRYGQRVEPTEGPVTAERVMAATRGTKFGDEVKRRIILGTHVLSAGFFDAYYGSAQKVRTLVQRDLATAFDQVDVLLTPTAPTVAFKFGDKTDDPMAMYLNDIATIPANLAGIPAMSIPAGLSDGLPVGIQVLAPAHHDGVMYRVAAALEAGTDNIPGQCPASQWEVQA